jgi:hypothetical protein
MTHDHGESQNYKELRLSEIIKQFLLSKIKHPAQKQSYTLNPQQKPPPPPPDGIKINHIAIILDGRVEEVIRCENRLAALLLSEPVFIEFNPEIAKVLIGKTEYENGEFKNKEPEIISEKEMDDLIQKEKDKRKDD